MKLLLVKIRLEMAKIFSRGIFCLQKGGRGGCLFVSEVFRRPVHFGNGFMRNPISLEKTFNEVVIAEGGGVLVRSCSVLC